MQEVFLIKSIFFYKGKWQKTREGKNQQKNMQKKSGKKLSTIIQAQFVPKIGQN